MKNDFAIYRRMWRIIFVVCFATVSVFAQDYDIEFTLHIVDTPNGFAAIIDKGDIEIIIDGGRSRTQLAEYLDKTGIIDGPIELVVVSHFHVDHFQGLFEIFDRYKVREFWSPTLHEDQSMAARELLSLVKERGVTNYNSLDSVHIPFLKDNKVRAIYLDKEKYIEINLLSVNAVKTSEGTNDIHDAGIVLKVVIGKVSMLFPGDLDSNRKENAETKSLEEQLLIGADQVKDLLKSDIMIASYHGSLRANGIELIRAVSPSYVVFPASPTFGLPHQNIIRRFATNGAFPLNTRLSPEALRENILFECSSTGEIAPFYKSLEPWQGKSDTGKPIDIGALRYFSVFSGANKKQEGDKFPRRDSLNYYNLSGLNLKGNYDLTGIILKGTVLRGVNFNGINLTGANFTGADLSYSKFQNCDLTSAKFDDAVLQFTDFRSSNLDSAQFNGGENRQDLTETLLQNTSLRYGIIKNSSLNYRIVKTLKLEGANLSGSNLRNSDLSNHNLINTNFQNANLAGVRFDSADLTNARLKDALITGASFHNAIMETEPGYGPNFNGLILSKDLPFLKYTESPHALVELRSSFKNGGLRDQEREITNAIETQRNVSFLESIFRYVLFDLTSLYGMSPGRPLVLLVILVLVLTPVYWFSLDSIKSGGIWKRSVIKDSDKQLIEPCRGNPLQCLRTAFYFSVLSAFNIGWRELNVGNWLGRMQWNDYTLQGKGWVRSVSGLQSIISVFLLALWAVTYFGRPFE